MTLQRLFLSACLLATFTCGQAFAQQVFHAKDGLLLIEAESTESELGKWELRETIEGYTGAGHLEFTGNRPPTGPANSPLEYRFTVDQDGLYLLKIRAHKRLVGDDGVQARKDYCNDCYVRVEGDFESGNETPLDVLKTDTKLYVHGPELWNMTHMLDYHDEETHKGIKTKPVYRLIAGEPYLLTISGRSQRFNMDRIVLKHESVDEETAYGPEQPESLRNN